MQEANEVLQSVASYEGYEARVSSDKTMNSGATCYMLESRSACESYRLSYYEQQIMRWDKAEERIDTKWINKQRRRANVLETEQ